MKNLNYFVKKEITPLADYMKDKIYESDSNSNTAFTEFENTPEEYKIWYEQHKDVFVKHGITPDVIDKLFDIVDEAPLIFNSSFTDVKLRRHFQRDRATDEIIRAMEEIGKYTKDGKYFIFNDAKLDNKGEKIKTVFGNGSAFGNKAGRNTQFQEQLFCEIVNNNNEGEFDIDKYLDKTGLGEDYKISAQSQYIKFLKISDKHVTYHAALAKSKDKVCKLIDKIIHYKKLFYNTPSTVVTPGDVYVYDIDKKDEIIESLSTIKDDPTMFNMTKQMFVDYLNNKTLIIVSLKKINKSNTENEVEFLNINKKYDVTVDRDDYNGYMTEGGFVAKFNLISKSTENIILNFRSNQGSIAPLTFEFNKKGDGGAAGKNKRYLIDIANKYNVHIPTTSDFEYIYSKWDIDDLKNFYINHNKNNIPHIKLNDMSDNDLKMLLDSPKKLFIFIQCYIFVEFLNTLYEESEDTFFSFIESSYLLAKKISEYSLPYVLIK